MSEQWVADELETVNFGDQRLNKRLINILQGFAARPNISIPAALGGRAELEAAYRFFDNDNVTPEKILKPHFEATQNRCKEQEVVLCAQDTSELDFTRPQQQVEGAGPLSSSSRHGAFLHLNETFTVNGVPLGAVGAKIWTRQQDENEVKLSPAEKRKLRRILPIEKKESFRWIEGIRDVQKLAEACPDTLCVSLSDSEGDIYELFVEPRKTDNFHWIVRACQDRALIEEDKTDMNGIDTIINENVTNTIRETIMQQPVLFTNEITVRGRQQLISCEKRSRRTTRIGRDAFVEVRAGEVTIQAPAQSKHAIRHCSLLFQ